MHSLVKAQPAYYTRTVEGTRVGHMQALPARLRSTRRHADSARCSAIAAAVADGLAPGEVELSTTTLLPLSRCRRRWGLTLACARTRAKVHRPPTRRRRRQQGQRRRRTRCCRQHGAGAYAAASASARRWRFSARGAKLADLTRTTTTAKAMKTATRARATRGRGPRHGVGAGLASAIVQQRERALSTTTNRHTYIGVPGVLLCRKGWAPAPAAGLR